MARVFKQVSESQAFKRFADFVTRQLQTVQAVIQNLAQVVGPLIDELGPVFARLTRIIAVFNTVAIGAMIEGLRRLVQPITEIIRRFEQFATAITGINVSNLTTDLESVIAILEVIPEVLDVIGAKFDQLIARIRLKIAEIVQGGANPIQDQFRFWFLNHFGLGQAYFDLTDIAAASEALAAANRDVASSSREAGEAFAEALQRINQRRAFINFAQIIQQRISDAKLLIAEFNQFINDKLLGIKNLREEEEGTQSKEKGSIVAIAELRNTIEQSIDKKNARDTAAASQSTAKNTEEMKRQLANMAIDIAAMRAGIPVVAVGAVRTIQQLSPGGGLSH
jgi:phage-related protein